MPPSCVLLGEFAIGARVALIVLPEICTCSLSKEAEMTTTGK